MSDCSGESLPTKLQTTATRLHITESARMDKFHKFVATKIQCVVYTLLQQLSIDQSGVHQLMKVSTAQTNKVNALEH